MELDQGIEIATGINALAQVVVRVGIMVKPGQQLVILSPDGGVPIETVPLVRRVTEHAYRAGASLVTTFYADDFSTRCRFRYANDESFDVGTDWLQSAVARAFQEGAAGLFILADDPNLLVAENEDKVSRASKAHLRARAPILTEIFNLRTNWSLTTAATSAWAQLLFPQTPRKNAVQRLWRAIFNAARLDSSDPIATWKAHAAKLNARAKAMNQRNLSAIHFRGPDTDLRIGLADQHTWTTVHRTCANPNGVQCLFNIPSEEINTVPDRNRVDGYTRMTKPLLSSGVLIEDIVVRFENGRVIQATARTGADVLGALLASDDGACRIGEVALVPNSSPISKSGILYYNTLLDENAASHIAFGQAWSVGIDGGLTMSVDQLLRHGANQSLIHLDTMIGSAEMDVDGITATGGTVPVMRSGEFVEELDFEA
jgi:aminopeptidase